MKKLLTPIISAVVFFVLIFILSYIIKPVGDFLAWWFITKEEINAPITTGQAVLIDLITHSITYISVGAIFGLLGKFNGKAMHVAYIIISESISLALAILLRVILDYYWVIFIIVGAIIMMAVLVFIVYKVKKNKKNVKEVPNNA